LALTLGSLVQALDGRAGPEGTVSFPRSDGFLCAFAKDRPSSVPLLIQQRQQQALLVSCGPLEEGEGQGGCRGTI